MIRCWIVSCGIAHALNVCHRHPPVETPAEQEEDKAEADKEEGAEGDEMKEEQEYKKRRGSYRSEPMLPALQRWAALSRVGFREGGPYKIGSFVPQPPM